MVTGSRALALVAGLCVVNVQATSALVDPPIHTIRALATTTSSTECTTEAQACGADEACGACAMSYLEALESCIANIGSEGGFCEEIGGVACCAADGCHDNVLYGALSGAWTFGCVVCAR